MNGVTTEIFLILGLLLLNGVLAMTELAVVSSKRALLRRRAEEGDKSAEAALRLAEEPGKFLSTVQVGITLVGLLAGAFGGGLVQRLEDFIILVPFMKPVAEPIAFVLIMAILTYLSLILGELVPKRVALSNPEVVAAFLAPMMESLARITGPVVRLLSRSSDIVLSVLRIKAQQADTVSDDEVKLLIDEGLSSGAFRQDEKEMVEGVLELDTLHVADIMTPRGRMVLINIDDPPDQIMQGILESGHSNFPVFERSRDQVVGILSIKALLANLTAKEPRPLRSILVAAHMVPETMSAHRLVDEFRRVERHIALVTDEYGGISGIATLNDIFEAIIGDLNQPEAKNKPQAVLREDGSYLIDAGIYVEEVKELLGIDEFPDEEDSEYHSLGGFIVERLGHIPTEGEYFDWNGCRFEVVDMDRHRLDKVLVKRFENKPGEDPAGKTAVSTSSIG